MNHKCYGSSLHHVELEGQLLLLDKIRCTSWDHYSKEIEWESFKHISTFLHHHHHHRHIIIIIIIILQLSSSSNFKLCFFVQQQFHQDTVELNFPSVETTPNVVLKALSPSPASWFSLGCRGCRCHCWEQLAHLHCDPPNREEVEVPFLLEGAPGAKARIHRHHLGEKMERWLLHCFFLLQVVKGHKS